MTSSQASTALNSGWAGPSRTASADSSGVDLALASRLLIACALAVVALLLSASGALAAIHPHTTFPVATSEASSIAIDRSNGDIYVSSYGSPSRVGKYDKNGNLITSYGTSGYLTGTNAPGGEFGAIASIALDPSTGDLYVADRNGGAYVYKYDKNGNLITSFGDTIGTKNGRLKGINVPTGQFSAPISIAVDPDAPHNIYIGDESSYYVTNFGPTGNYLGQFYSEYGPPMGLAVSEAGRVYVVTGIEFFFAYDPTTGAPESYLEGNQAITDVAIDPADQHVYGLETTQIVRFNATDEFVERYGSEHISSATGIEVGEFETTYVPDRNQDEVDVFAPLLILPVPTTKAASGVTRSTAQLNGEVDPEGLAVTSCNFEYVTETAFQATGFTNLASGGTTPCVAPSAAEIPVDSDPHPVKSTSLTVKAETAYRFRLSAGNANGTEFSTTRTFTTPPAVTNVKTEEPTEVTKTCQFPPFCPSFFSFEYVALQRDSATINGSFTGDGEAVESHFEWGVGTASPNKTPLTPVLPSPSPPGKVDVSHKLTGLASGTTYVYRFIAENKYGETRAPTTANFKTPPAVPSLKTEPATNITDRSADLNASYTGEAGLSTTLYFEYGATTAYTRKTAPIVQTPGAAGPQTATAPVANLVGNTTYNYRVVAENSYGKTIGQNVTFKTFNRPTIESVFVTEVTASTAILHAEVHPQGFPTTYHFDWGPSTTYGNTAPDPEGEITTGLNESHSIEVELTGLPSDSGYHFRFVATNQWDTAVSEDQSFSFYPHSCPNADVRQQTGSGYLPDCRAYELVSPPEAGNATINSFTGPSSGLATSPSRLAFVSHFSPLPGGDPPNSDDLNISTRTSSGWVTKHVGGEATESFTWGGPPGPGFLAGRPFRNVQATPGLDKVLLWHLGNPQNNLTGNPDINPQGASNAPFVFSADGEELERWPTNLASVPNGEEFRSHTSKMMASDDLTHFIFSSDMPFIPGAPVTALYDNNALTGELEIISKDPNELDFVGYPLDVSTDGSHVLMSDATVPVCNEVKFFSPAQAPGQAPLQVEQRCPKIPPGHLYTRVDGSVTYDVTKGHKGTWAGATKDGSKVYFLSDEKVMAGEQDTSTDLFMWTEEGDELINVSSGDPGDTVGDTDGCNAVAFDHDHDPVITPNQPWASKCSVELIFTYEQRCGGITNSNACETFVPKPTFYNGLVAERTRETESQIASESGDIYFYSPEQLDGDDKGAAGKQNLYVFRGGETQYVTTLDPTQVCRASYRADDVYLGHHSQCADGPIARMQVTPDGRFAAFTAITRLTNYDNVGIEMMYRYSADAEQVICVSCLPSGKSPTVEVLGSQNGLFLTADGRTFFTTTDALQADDTNKAQDVYQYSEGRPQLITTGTGATYEPHINLGQFLKAGLIGVSLDGKDVYFGTADVLIDEDHNGGNLKIYDARTAGGFPTATAPPPCEAADECHGPAAIEPIPAQSGTGVNLGDRGNVAKRKPKKCRKGFVRSKKAGRCVKKKRANAKRSKARKHG